MPSVWIIVHWTQCCHHPAVCNWLCDITVARMNPFRKNSRWHWSSSHFGPGRGSLGSSPCLKWRNGGECDFVNISTSLIAIKWLGIWHRERIYSPKPSHISAPCCLEQGHTLVLYNFCDAISPKEPCEPQQLGCSHLLHTMSHDHDLLCRESYF